MVGVTGTRRSPLPRRLDEYSGIHRPGLCRLPDRRPPGIVDRAGRWRGSGPPADPVFQSGHPLRHWRIPGFRDRHFLGRGRRLRERRILQYPDRHVPGDCHNPRRFIGRISGGVGTDQSDCHYFWRSASVLRVSFTEAPHSRRNATLPRTRWLLDCASTEASPTWKVREATTCNASRRASASCLGRALCQDCSVSAPVP